MAHIREAWNITTGSNNVKVGIMDTGISSNVEYYSDNYDSSLGKSFTDSQNDSYNVDDYGHGTYIASIIGSNSVVQVGSQNNYVNKLYRGVCPNVKMVSLKIFNNNDYIIGNQRDEYYKVRSLRVASALSYAAEKGIKIINSSIGSDQLDIANSQIEQQAIKNYNGLIVSAVGNDGVDIDQSPRYLPSYNFDNILTVGYLSMTNSFPCDHQGRPMTNYGARSVDLFAPGNAILSVSPSGEFETITGTSFAAPFVTGVAALLLSKYPNLTPLMIKKIILETVDVQSSLTGKCVSNGKLNAYKALTLNNIEGNGTETSPYLIKNEFDYNCIQALDGPGVYFKQVANINFDYKEHHLNEFTFKGIYNGNNYSLQNIAVFKQSLPNKQNIGGLFGINNGTIQYVKINNTMIELNFDTTYTHNIGTIAGQNSGYIYNCELNNGFTTSFSPNINTGGLVGTNCNGSSLDSIRNCIVSNSRFFSTGHTGGIVGENEEGIINYCDLVSTYISFSQENLTNKACGGIVGFNKDNVKQSDVDSSSVIYYSGASTTQLIKPYMGIIIGLNWYPYVDISSCIASGELRKGNLNSAYGQLDNFGTYSEQKIGRND